MGLVKKKSTEPYINFNQERYLNYGLSNMINSTYISVRPDEKLTTEKCAVFLSNSTKLQKRFLDVNGNVLRTIDFCTIPYGSVYSFAIQDKYVIVLNASSNVFIYDMYGNLITRFTPPIGIGEATGVHYSNLIVICNSSTVGVYDLSMNLLYSFSLTGGSARYSHKLFNKCYLVGGSSGTSNSAIIYPTSTGFTSQLTNGANVNEFLGQLSRKIKGGAL